jgi:TatA/E family protein of Tat protein translocase
MDLFANMLKLIPGGYEWIFIILIMVVLIFGAKKIPELARSFGKAKSEFEKAPGNFAASSLQSLATNVTGVTVPLSGHWVPEERLDFVIDQLSKFFGNKLPYR